MKVTKKRTFAIAGIAMLAMTMLAGCAGTTDKADNDGEVTNSTYEQEYAAWTAKYDACLKEQGIELPKRKPNELVNLDSLGVDAKVFEKASRECSSKVGTAPVDPTVPTEDEFYDMQLAFAKCMRDAGYDWEDPAPPADGMSAGAKPIDPSKYDEADLNTCAETAGFGTGSK